MSIDSELVLGQMQIRCFLCHEMGCDTKTCDCECHSKFESAHAALLRLSKKAGLFDTIAASIRGEI